MVNISFVDPEGVLHTYDTHIDWSNAATQAWIQNAAPVQRVPMDETEQEPVVDLFRSHLAYTIADFYGINVLVVMRWLDMVDGDEFIVTLAAERLRAGFPLSAESIVCRGQ